MHQVCFQQVQAHGLWRASPLRLFAAQLCRNTEKNVVEGGPAGCEKTDESLDISLCKRLLVCWKQDSWRAEVGGSVSRHALHDLERLKGGRYSEGKVRSRSYRRIARTGNDELMQRHLFVLACSTPSNPIERLSKDAAVSPNFERNSDGSDTHEYIPSE